MIRRLLQIAFGGVIIDQRGLKEDLEALRELTVMTIIEFCKRQDLKTAIILWRALQRIKEGKNLAVNIYVIYEVARRYGSIQNALRESLISFSLDLIERLRKIEGLSWNELIHSGNKGFLILERDLSERDFDEIMDEFKKLSKLVLVTGSFN